MPSIQEGNELPSNETKVHGNAPEDPLGACKHLRGGCASTGLEPSLTRGAAHMSIKLAHRRRSWLLKHSRQLTHPLPSSSLSFLCTGPIATKPEPSTLPFPSRIVKWQSSRMPARKGAMNNHWSNLRNTAVPSLNRLIAFFGILDWMGPASTLSQIPRPEGGTLFFPRRRGKMTLMWACCQKN